MKLKLKFRNVWALTGMILFGLALVCLFTTQWVGFIGFFGSTVFCAWKAR